MTTRRKSSSGNGSPSLDTRLELALSGMNARIDLSHEVMDDRFRTSHMAMETAFERFGADHPSFRKEVRKAEQEAERMRKAGLFQTRQTSTETSSSRPGKTYRSGYADHFKPNSVLSRAGDLIRKQGWAQGVMTGKDGSLCAIAAIDAAAGSDSSLERDEAVTALLARIRNNFGRSEKSVQSFNDKRGRKREDVLRLLY